MARLSEIFDGDAVFVMRGHFLADVDVVLVGVSIFSEIVKVEVFAYLFTLCLSVVYYLLWDQLALREHILVQLAVLLELPDALFKLLLLPELSLSVYFDFLTGLSD